MKTIALTLLTFIFLFGVNDPIKKVSFKVEGMTCQACADGAKSKLSQIEGLKSYSVDYDNKIAIIEYDESKLNYEALVKNLDKMPYTFTLIVD